MIVTFVSQCEKKALARTRRVLDAYANRIGEHVWQTMMTEEGLLMVKKMLRQTASKNTAVSCHWIRSRRRTDLLWIVGNRNKFNSEGHVPVNRTVKKLVVKDMEGDWRYLSMIKGLTALSALLHDWGKSSDLFQKKLTAKNNQANKGDPLRHEWISCLLLQSLVMSSGDMETDDGWLKLLADNQWDDGRLIKEMQTLEKNGGFQQLKKMPPLASMVMWLILTHHRLPDLKSRHGQNGCDGFDEFSKEALPSLIEFFETIQVNWGYENRFDDFKKQLPKCFRFSHGLLKDAVQWNADLQRWAKKLLACTNLAVEASCHGSWRAIIQYARLSLMLGDHYCSSLPLDYRAGQPWRKTTELMANTDKKTKIPKQYLDEHLHGVYQHGVQAAQYLKNLTFEMPLAHDLKKIKAASPKQFMWQDQAVKAIKDLRKQDDFNGDQGWFIVNMASTGTGKTIANAKVMQALSEDGDSLRYILALGLRTLTLQTGDAYREHLGMEKEDLAVLIGSKVVQELHEEGKKHADDDLLHPSNDEEVGSESLETLLDDDIDFFEGQFYPEFMNVLFPQNDAHSAEKNKAFLYQPVLVCTIDHIMGATETVRGGKYLLPYLRLLSSDLVVDEVDDFGVEDLIPLARLVHLAGMLGRKVMISSATIPPSLAAGLFNAYQKGFHIFVNFRNIQQAIVNVMWIDEFKSTVSALRLSDKHINLEHYQQNHHAYIEARSQKLFEQVVKQRAKIIPCEHLRPQQATYDEGTLQNQYFELIKQTIEDLHAHHHTIDAVSGKKISFGVVRVANISPCVALTRYLLSAQCSDNNALRVMAYHSRQVLLLRSTQERHLDAVLSRKEQEGEQPRAFANPVIRAHINHCDADNIIFVVVATPVEEVGRDHDFDWAVIEPSSYRSIIQLSGRVLRHRGRKQNIVEPNIALLQFNWKGLLNRDVAFNHPGFELSQPESFKLATKNLSELIEHEHQCLNINAIPRIRENEILMSRNNLADLEHARIRNQLMNHQQVGAKYVHGWLEDAWFLTGLPQRFYRFRNSAPNVQLFAVYQNDAISFCEKNKEGDWLNRDEWYGIEPINLSNEEMERLWLKRDYRSILYARIQRQLEIDADEHILLEKASKRYGEIMLPDVSKRGKYQYSDQLGLF